MTVAVRVLSAVDYSCLTLHIPATQGCCICVITAVNSMSTCEELDLKQHVVLSTNDAPNMSSNTVQHLPAAALVSLHAQMILCRHSTAVQDLTARCKGWLQAPLLTPEIGLAASLWQVEGLDECLQGDQTAQTTLHETQHETCESTFGMIWFEKQALLMFTLEMYLVCYHNQLQLHLIH